MTEKESIINGRVLIRVFSLTVASTASLFRLLAIATDSHHNKFN
ncbi:hypothetical protein [Dickeya oryzae]|uniref:Uncharacterized protein n=1 Tax=Dickeya oryzae TaxID=1240404 RepID=A0AB39ID25_9GAMM|nr:hypothetical protein [Dickeya oryzae]